MFQQLRPQMLGMCLDNCLLCSNILIFPSLFRYVFNFSCRNPDYYGDEHLTTTSDGNLAHIAGVDAGTYEHSSISQSEALKSEPTETAQENQYSFPSSSHEFTYENVQQPDATYPHSQTSSQIQNLSPFSSVMVMHRILRSLDLQYTTYVMTGSYFGSSCNYLAILLSALNIVQFFGRLIPILCPVLCWLQLFKQQEMISHTHPSLQRNQCLPNIATLLLQLMVPL